MWLRCKVGPYDGQILRYSIPAGKNLLQSGLAEKPTEEELAAFFAGSGTEKAVLPEPEKPVIEQTRKPAPAKKRTARKATKRSTAKKR